MKLLLDTHVLLWAAFTPDKLSLFAQEFIQSPSNQVFFSTASIWEVAIKFERQRKDFTTHPLDLRKALLEVRYEELPITCEHTAETIKLPRLHRDPFDRLLIAQAIVEGMQFLTADTDLLQYPGPILPA